LVCYPFHKCSTLCHYFFLIGQGQKSLVTCSTSNASSTKESIICVKGNDQQIKCYHFARFWSKDQQVEFWMCGQEMHQQILFQRLRPLRSQPSPEACKSHRKISSWYRTTGRDLCLVSRIWCHEINNYLFMQAVYKRMYFTREFLQWIALETSNNAIRLVAYALCYRLYKKWFWHSII
jgi:hypothetical protein